MKFIYSCIGLFFYGALSGFTIDKLNKTKPLYGTEMLSHEKVARFFASFRPKFSHAVVVTDVDYLYNVAQDTLRALSHYKSCGGLLKKQGLRQLIDEGRTIKTLEFIIKTVEEDRARGVGSHLKDPHFLQKHFKFLSWKPDQHTASKHLVKMQDENDVRLTHYVVFKAQALHKKTGHHSFALYQLLDDSIALRYTKQEIVSGILELPEHKNKVKPLAWVTRDSLEDALLQGTIMLSFPDGSKKLFVVHTNNGIAYDKKEKNKRNQKRYWYFAPVENEQAFIKKLDERREIVLAGDINSLGLGRLIILDYINKRKKRRELRLCILADTGAAFLNNAYQLDVFAGVFPSQKLVDLHVSRQPMFARAHIAYR